MPRQMQFGVSVNIVSFLKHRYVISPAFMQVRVFITVQRVYLKPYNSKIFARQPYGGSNIFHAAHAAAFTG